MSQSQNTSSIKTPEHINSDIKVTMPWGEVKSYQDLTTNNNYVEYFMKRYMEQVNWYDRKAVQNKKVFMWYQRIVIFLGALIPIIVAFGSFIPVVKTYSGLVSAVISGFIAIIAALDKLQQPMSNWFNYRSIAENLKKEQFYYEFNIGPYEKMKEQSKKKLFVERVEGTVASDINRFLQAKQQKDDDDDNPTDTVAPNVSGASSE